jgi:hypothetical protein
MGTARNFSGGRGQKICIINLHLRCNAAKFSFLFKIDG